MDGMVAVPKRSFFELLRVKLKVLSLQHKRDDRNRYAAEFFSHTSQLNGKEQ